MSEPDLKHKVRLGQQGENLAKEYLEKQGYQVLHTNYRIKRWGELDIIAVDNDTLVFVEVKTRKYPQRTKAYHAMDKRKIRALKRSAYRFLVEQRDTPQFRQLPQAYRLDLVTVEFKAQEEKPFIKLYKNIEDWD